MELLGIYISAFIIALSGALMPGPMFTYTISEAAKKGIWAGPVLMIGHAVLEMILIVFLVMGFGSFLTHDITFGIIGSIGAVIMVYMAVGMFRSIPALTLNLKGESNDKKSMNPILAGVVISISNPYWTIWWATIGIGYVMLALKSGIFGVGIFFAGHISADVLWYFFLSFGVAKGKKLISDKLYKLVIGCCGAALLYFAFVFGNEGLQKLINM